MLHPACRFHPVQVLCSIPRLINLRHGAIASFLNNQTKNTHLTKVTQTGEKAERISTPSILLVYHILKYYDVSAECDPKTSSIIEARATWISRIVPGSRRVIAQRIARIASSRLAFACRPILRVPELPSSFLRQKIASVPVGIEGPVDSIELVVYMTSSEPTFLIYSV
jgi:hypothetical protein